MPRRIRKSITSKRDDMANKNQINKRYAKWGYIFVLPFVIVFVTCSLWPILSTIYYAFCDLKHAGNTHPEFLPLIGKPLLKNFKDIFKSKSFWDALKNTMLFFLVMREILSKNAFLFSSKRYWIVPVEYTISNCSSVSKVLMSSTYALIPTPFSFAIRKVFFMPFSATSKAVTL